MKKGQISIEFILLLVVIILLIQSITLPYLEVAESASSDVLRVSQARVASQRIFDAVNSVNAAGSEARQSFRVFVPKKTQISCSNNKIQFKVNLELSSEVPVVVGDKCACYVGGQDPCNSAYCSAEFATNTPKLICAGFGSKADNLAGAFPVMLEVVVEKAGDEVHLSAQSG